MFFEQGYLDTLEKLGQGNWGGSFKSQWQPQKRGPSDFGEYGVPGYRKIGPSGASFPSPLTRVQSITRRRAKEKQDRPLRADSGVWKGMQYYGR